MRKFEIRIGPVRTVLGAHASVVKGVGSWPAHSILALFLNMLCNLVALLFLLFSLFVPELFLPAHILVFCHAMSLLFFPSSLLVAHVLLQFELTIRLLLRMVLLVLSKSSFVFKLLLLAVSCLFSSMQLLFHQPVVLFMLMLLLDCLELSFICLMLSLHFFLLLMKLFLPLLVVMLTLVLYSVHF